MLLAKGLPLAFAAVVCSGAFPTPGVAGSSERYACEDSCVTRYVNRSCIDKWTPPSSKSPKDVAVWIISKDMNDPCWVFYDLVSACVSGCIKDNPDVSKWVPGPNFAHYLHPYCQKPIEDAFPKGCGK